MDVVHPNHSMSLHGLAQNQGINDWVGGKLAGSSDWKSNSQLFIVKLAFPKLGAYKVRWEDGSWVCSATREGKLETLMSSAIPCWGG